MLSYHSKFLGAVNGHEQFKHTKSWKPAVRNTGCKNLMSCVETATSQRLMMWIGQGKHAEKKRLRHGVVTPAEAALRGLTRPEHGSLQDAKNFRSSSLPESVRISTTDLRPDLLSRCKISLAVFRRLLCKKAEAWRGLKETQREAKYHVPITHLTGAWTGFRAWGKHFSQS